MSDEPMQPPGDESEDYRYKYKYRYKYAEQHPVADAENNQSAAGDTDDGDDEQSKIKDADKRKKDGDAKNKSPAQEQADKRKKYWIFGAIGAFFLLGGLIWVLLYIFVFSQREKTDDAYVGGNQVIISSKVSGTVVQVLVDDTELVHAGQVLVRLDPADAGAALAGAEGALAQAVRQVEQQGQTASQADEQVIARKADADRAAAEYARRQPLLAAQATSGEDVSNALAQLKSARAALRQAQRQAGAAHAPVDGVDVRENPGVLQARAQYINAWVNNSRDAIVAPIDGYAAQREVQLGQQVQPGQRLLVLVPLDQLWVDANFKEGQLRNLRIGQPAEIEPDVYHGEVVFHGQVVGLGAGTGGAFSLLPPQNASGNWIKIVQRVPVRIALDPHELRVNPLRIGLSTDTKVDTHNRSGAVLAAAARQQPLSTTSVYSDDLKRAEDAADAIIARNVEGVLRARPIGD